MVLTSRAVVAKPMKLSETWWKSENNPCMGCLERISRQSDGDVRATGRQVSALLFIASLEGRYGKVY